MELLPSSFRAVYTSGPDDRWVDVWVLCQPCRPSAIRSRLGDPYLQLDTPRLAHIGSYAFVGRSLSLVQPKQIWDIDRRKLESLVPEGHVPIRRLTRDV